MYSKELNAFFLNIEYKSERNISLVRSIILLAVTGLFVVLSLKTDSYNYLLLPLSISAFVSVILFADVVLLYRHPRAAKSIKIAKYLAVPLDVFYLSLLIYFVYENKLVYISPGWGLTMIILGLAAITWLLCIFRISAICVVLNFLSIAGAWVYINYYLERNLFFIISLLRFKQLILHEIVFYAFLIILMLLSLLAALSMRKRIIQVLDEQRYRRFLSQELVGQLLKGRKSIVENPERQQVTLFGAEIRLFTAIAEKNKPENVRKFFNHFLEEMTEIIYKHDGMLDCVTDTGFRAIFGAPFADVRAAENAVRAAYAIQKATSELRLGIPIHLGIGIHSDETICGYTGPLHHRDYTVLGEAITVLNGIVELTKQTKQTIIISETCREQLPQGIDAQKLGSAKIKGKKEGITVFTPIIQ
ncbi:MAG: adenylate/guanylate cyclase domain-containing protein [Spirochaetales bacterium]|nr:adenylate/guanylate cyclase domain-containing protein [Spirochaetales bacterium]